MEKQTTPTLHILGFLFLVISAFTGSAQVIQFLNSNNIYAGIRIGGNQFCDSDLQVPRYFETPAGSNIDAIFTQSLWLTGLDVNDSLHCAANRYFDYGKDFFDGPITTTYDSAYDVYYNRVWKVTQAQISQFKALQFPTTEAQVAPSILYWPGKGNPSVLSDYNVNISSALAPFVDLNNNGIYEPLLGDYPDICGDEGIFFVYNDIRSAHTETNGTPLGIEIRGLASSFTDSTPTGPYAKRAINNTVFVQYDIENKSANNYHDFDFGQWVDPDVGCFSNDQVGCDTGRDLMFAYNGTNLDPDCAPENGYGTLPIALGVKLLNQSMGIFGYFTGQGASSAAMSDPITAAQYRDYLEGFWADGTPFTNGGTGYGGVDPTNFIFPSDPNDTTGWSEETIDAVPGDRRMYMSTHGINLSAGEIMHFDYAFFTSFDSTSDRNRIVDTLKMS